MVQFPWLVLDLWGCQAWCAQLTALYASAPRQPVADWQHQHCLETKVLLVDDGIWQHASGCIQCVIGIKTNSNHIAKVVLQATFCICIEVVVDVTSR
jgi:hypothetical protein